MSVRIYVYEDIDNRIEFLAKKFSISKAQVVEIAINDYFRKVQGPVDKNELQKRWIVMTLGQIVFFKWGGTDRKGFIIGESTKHYYIHFEYRPGQIKEVWLHKNVCRLEEIPDVWKFPKKIVWWRTDKTNQK